MRPIRIEVEGFSTFKDRTTIEFDAVDLVAFVGPTGSGKSTVIDAMTFALYGSVARYGDVRLVAPVIHQGSAEARVRLDFELGGAEYTAVRVVRRTKSSSTKAAGASTREARLEKNDGLDEGEHPVIASGAKEVTKAVEALLGLDFTQFTRTVVLPQGEFAQFLRDEPADRQELLSRLLDFGVYSRMGSKAREQARGNGQQIEALERQVQRWADVTADTLVQAERHRDGLVRFAADASAALGRAAEVETELVGLRSQVGELDSAAEALRDIVVPADVSELNARMAEADRLSEEAAAKLAEARQQRDQADEALAAAGDPVVLSRVLEALERRAELVRMVEEASTQLEQQVEAATAAQAEHATASTRLDEARAAVAKLRANADAAQWVSSLVVGEPCPVCRQDVVDIPDHDVSSELAIAGEAERVAVAAEKAAATARRDVETQRDRLEAKLADGRAQVDKQASIISDAAEAASDGTEPDPDALRQQIEAAGEAKTKAQQASVAAKEAEKVADVASTRRRRLDEAEQKARRTFGQLRDAVAKLGPPAPEGVSLLADFVDLVAWSEGQQLELVKQREKISDAGKALAAEKSELLTALADGARPFSLSVDNLADELAGARSAAELQVAKIATGLEEKAELNRQIEALASERQVMDTLGRLLSATGFERWLLAEAMEDLVERATVQLYELSSQQFSLKATDNSFEIIDHRNADNTRDVRTLSGGETFLASLALALALSDSIAEMAPVDTPRLGSMFLDEGFGTLDPETLDLVASAIEELSASGRLVGIVTHIEALAERMPVRFRVAKGPTTSVITKEIS